MDFRAAMLILATWLLSFSTHAVSSKMDELNLLVNQTPELARQEVLELKQRLQLTNASPAQLLRLDLLQCQILLQYADYPSAIELARSSHERATQLGIINVLPYFAGCQAQALAAQYQLTLALPLLDGAIAQARDLHQSQALTGLLLLRAQLDIEQENYLPAMEDLRLALDAYADRHHQDNHWYWPPKAYLYTTLADLLYRSGDLVQAIRYQYQALAEPDARSKVRHILLLNAARMTLENGEKATSEQLLNESRSLLSSLTVPTELAASYITMAVIALDDGNRPQAEQLTREALQIFHQYQHPTGIMQGYSLLATIQFAMGHHNAALKLSQQALEQAKVLGLQQQQAILHLKLSDYFASQHQFETAYHHLQQSRQAETHHLALRHNTRFIQFKARLDHELNQHYPGSEQWDTDTIDWQPPMLLGALLFPALLYYLLQLRPQRLLAYIRRPTRRRIPLYQQTLIRAMQHAKQHHQPMSILLLAVEQVPAQRRGQLESQLRSALRAQDKLLHQSADGIILLLPLTDHRGAGKVLQQQEANLQRWLPQLTVALGMASMQQFDTPSSMLKRAQANQVRQHREQGAAVYQATVR